MRDCIDYQPRYEPWLQSVLTGATTEAAAVAVQLAEAGLHALGVLFFAMQPMLDARDELGEGEVKGRCRVACRAMGAEGVPR